MPRSRSRRRTLAGRFGAEVSLNAQGTGPALTTHVCDVAVDPETGGHVKVLRHVEGRIQGGRTLGFGWATGREIHVQ